MNLEVFLRQSNLIEGIERPVTQEELSTTRSFLALPEVRVSHVVELVKVYQPDANLRLARGMNVRVGNHVAPPGGPDIFNDLDRHLREMKNRSPWENHCRYETLHPFTDGNGRSGRALWLWQMQKVGHAELPLSFLQMFYYQTLAAYHPSRV